MELTLNTKIKNVEYYIHNRLKGTLNFYNTIGELFNDLNKDARLFDGSDYESDLYEDWVIEDLEEQESFVYNDDGERVWKNYYVIGERCHSAIIFELVDDNE